MRDYGKVYSTFWSSQTTATLSADGKLLALYLLTCSHSTIAGVFRLPDGYVAEDLGWVNERVQQGFAELFAKGFANRCRTTKWVWVTKHLEWNKPENPNQRKSAAKIATSIPPECCWKREFMRVCGEALDLQPLPEDDGCATLTEGFLNQKQEQEQEQEKKPSAPSAVKPQTAPACPHEQIVAIYHEVLPSMPAVRLVSESRKKAMRSWWQWILTSKKPGGDRRAETTEQALAWIRDYFERATHNDFLMGRGHRSADHANWRCDLDFLITERGMRHVIEKTEVAA